MKGNVQGCRQDAELALNVFHIRVGDRALADGDGIVACGRSAACGGGELRRTGEVGVQRGEGQCRQFVAIPYGFAVGKDAGGWQLSGRDNLKLPVERLASAVGVFDIDSDRSLLQHPDVSVGNREYARGGHCVDGIASHVPCYAVGELGHYLQRIGIPRLHVCRHIAQCDILGFQLADGEGVRFCILLIPVEKRYEATLWVIPPVQRAILRRLVHFIIIV